MTKKLTLCLAVIILVSPVFAALSFAQVDPEKALIGTWSAQEESIRIVIYSVKATGNDEWVGHASQSGGRNIEINIWKKDGEIYLEWISARTRAPFHVKMTGDDKMEGTIAGFLTAHSLAGTPGHQVPTRRITFEKAKAGEVK